MSKKTKKENKNEAVTETIKESSTTVAVKPPKKKRTVKSWQIIAGVVVITIAIRVGISAYKTATTDTSPMVEVCSVERGDIISTLDTSGVIGSEETKVYASPVNANIGEVPVEVGQKVLKGEYLLTFDTTSLQKSYDIAELQNKAEQATVDNSIAKSNENAAEMASSAAKMNTLQGQIDGTNAELHSLQSQQTDLEVAANNSAKESAKLTEMKADLQGIEAQITELKAKKDQKIITDKEKERLEKLKATRDEKKEKIKEQEKKVEDSTEIANKSARLSAEIARKSSSLSELQSEYATEEGKNSSAEAGILTEQEKANLNYTTEAGKLTLQQAADDLSAAKAGITAGFDGIVSEVMVSSGSAAAEGTPLITICDASNMCLDVTVSKYNLENIEVGQKAVITFREKEYDGTVSNISKIATKTESGASMVNVRIHFENPDDELIIGLDAKVEISLGSAADTLMVPISCINSDIDGDFVYVMEDNMVVRKDVVTGMASKDNMEIKEGLSEGDEVITTINSTIQEGIRVQKAPQENLEVSTESTVETDEAVESTEEAVEASAE